MEHAAGQELVLGSVLLGRPMEARRLEQRAGQQAGPMPEERVEQPEERAVVHIAAGQLAGNTEAGPEAGRTAGPGRLVVGHTAELLAGLHRQLPCSL